MLKLVLPLTGSIKRRIWYKSYAEKLSWLRQMIEWQKDARDPDEFMENLKIDLFTDEVFVLPLKEMLKASERVNTH